MSMLAAALLAIASAAAPADPPRLRPELLIVVRQETRPPITPEMFRRIAAEAQAIWRPYVDIAFQLADSLEPRRGDETLDLVLSDRQSNGRTTPGLGWIDFVDGEPSRTITVSIGAARELVAVSRWAGRFLSAWPPTLRDTFLTRAIGRGVAHELGHYLLRSKAHSPGGLMRARFTVDEIMERGLSRYRLRPADEALLDQRATAFRLARRPAADPAPPQ
jgi:hypothetical protein